MPELPSPGILEFGIGKDHPQGSRVTAGSLGRAISFSDFILSVNVGFIPRFMAVVWGSARSCGCGRSSSIPKDPGSPWGH